MDKTLQLSRQKSIYIHPMHVPTVWGCRGLPVVFGSLWMRRWVARQWCHLRRVELEIQLSQQGDLCKWEIGMGPGPSTDLRWTPDLNGMESEVALSAATACLLFCRNLEIHLLCHLKGHSGQVCGTRGCVCMVCLCVTCVCVCVCVCVHTLCVSCVCDVCVCVCVCSYFVCFMCVCAFVCFQLPGGPVSAASWPADDGWARSSMGTVPQPIQCLTECRVSGVLDFFSLFICVFVCGGGRTGSKDLSYHLCLCLALSVSVSPSVPLLTHNRILQMQKLIKLPSAKNPELPIKFWAWSILEYSLACFYCCQEFHRSDFCLHISCWWSYPLLAFKGASTVCSALQEESDKAFPILTFIGLCFTQEDVPNHNQVQWFFNPFWTLPLAEQIFNVDSTSF